ncbi:MAG: RluA family pseudouridine synthase [Planctomycetota bacterium]
MRLDIFLASRFKKLSRSWIRKLIDGGFVEVEGARAKPARKLAGGEHVSLFLPELVELEARPEPMDLDILHEDAWLIVVNKPSGTVVHPSPGHETGSLVNGLLFHCRDLSGIGGVLRPGIVHRLDRDTSGVLVAAKNDLAHRSLSAQFARRTTLKIYLALTHGTPVPPSGTVEGFIGRHPRHRQRMAIVRIGGRRAVTHYAVREAFGAFSLVECRLETGRTHQIRVHLASISCPVLCDASYGREAMLTRTDLSGRHRGQAGAEGSRVILARQGLHAFRLGFDHPASGERLEFEAPLAPDMRRALRILRARSHAGDE